YPSARRLGRQRPDRRASPSCIARGVFCCRRAPATPRAATYGRTDMKGQPSMTEDASITGAQSLVRSLEEVGADGVFGIPGGAILPAYDPMMDSSKVRHVLVRHEQGAGHAATGYAQATGKVGVCMATSGPGATNLVTPIAD